MSRATKRQDCLLEPEIDRVLALLADPAPAPSATRAERRLDGLFRALAETPGGAAAGQVEDLIWALWIAHPQPDAERDMAAALDAMAAGALDLARPILDRLVEAHPGWAEAWNKRATLAFMEHRDEDALRDIGRTLRLEPRHFGAVAGFAQICLRHGRLAEARAGFRLALTLNPHLDGLREALSDLDGLAQPLH